MSSKFSMERPSVPQNLMFPISSPCVSTNSEFYRDQPTNNMPLTHRDNHSFIFLLCEFDFLKEHGFVSVIFVTDGRNMYHAPSIRHLVKRSGQEVPQLLD